MARINIMIDEEGHEMHIGDQVMLTGREFSGYASTNNPYFSSDYACGGVITSAHSSNTVHVRWDNGQNSQYNGEHLITINEGFRFVNGITVEPRSVGFNNNKSETVSAVLNQNIMFGDKILYKQGTRMFMEGDYIHDSDKTIFIHYADVLKDKTITKLKKQIQK